MFSAFFPKGFPAADQEKARTRPKDGMIFQIHSVKPRGLGIRLEANQ